MSIPAIGLTTSRTLNRRGLDTISITEAYVQAVVLAGGAPLLIPLGLPEAALHKLLQQIDGILFTGGGDMQPQSYGSQPHPKVSNVDPDRDRIELYLFHQIVQRRLPFLGICRGLQVINVALGGTLYEDITDQHPQAIRHDYYPGFRRDHAAHSVQVEPHSRLYQILGKTISPVNSLHHQGIRLMADSLQATAFAADGIIEGIEMPGYPFGLAVQWHPEWLLQDEAMRNLFKSFILAANQESSPR